MTTHKLLTPDILQTLSGQVDGPCLSLYFPTHRHHPENRQDPIRFGGLVKGLEQTLEKDGSAAVAEMFARFHALGDDLNFWNHTLDGLAIFAAPGGFFKVITLQRTVKELAIVADSFHTKPLRRMLQSSDRYQVLALTMTGIKLYEGNRDALDVVELAREVPHTLTDALGEELTDPHSTVASYGGVKGGGGGGDMGGEQMEMHHGHGGRKDQEDIDEIRYYRVIDRAILKHHSNTSRLPLMMAALAEHQGNFHKVSNNPYLLSEGIKINPDVLTPDELRARAWDAFEPHYEEKTSKLAEDYLTAKANDQGLDEPGEIAAAARDGRVATLLIEADRQIAGRINPDTGEISKGDIAHPGTDDLLDDLGELVAAMGGTVLVVRSEKMPSGSGAAAICRF